MLANRSTSSSLEELNIILRLDIQGKSTTITLTNILICEDIKICKLDVFIPQQACNLPGESTARRVRTAFHEQNHLALVHQGSHSFLQLFWGLLRLVFLS